MFKTIYVLFAVTFNTGGDSAIRIAGQYDTSEACFKQEFVIEQASPIIFAKCSSKEIRID